MRYTLNYHPERYSYPTNYFKEQGIFSPSPYAKRHEQLADENALRSSGHRLVAKIESVRGLGHLAGLIESALVNSFELLFSPHTKKMKNNLNEALADYRKDITNPLEVSLIGTPEQLVKRSKKPLTEITHTSAANKGGRKEMEDAHFIKETEEELLVGIFDGHGGKKTAKFAVSYFKKASFQGEVRSSFIKHFKNLQKKVTNENKEDSSGCTSLVMRLNKKTSQVYLASVGDCEGFYYRQVEGEMKCFPLLPKRHWGIKKEAERVARALGDPDIVERYTEAKSVKEIRYPESFGLNCSRAIGDSAIAGAFDHPVVHHKPKVSMAHVDKGFLVLGCDGMTEHLKNHSEIIQILETDPANPAQALMAQALTHKKRGSDNITLVVIKL